MQIKRGDHFSSLDLGNLEKLMQYRFEHDSFPFAVEGKKFLRDDLALSGMEVSVQELPPRFAVPFHHRHKENEELYFFLGGRGEFQIDGEIIPVREGTVIRVSPGGVRTWRNNSDEALYYLVIQAKAGSMNGSDISDGEDVKKKVVWPD